MKTISVRRTQTGRQLRASDQKADGCAPRIPRLLVVSPLQ